MRSPTFGGKPSDTHVIWRDSEGGDKRFDEEALCSWCSHYGVDFETSKRVDHDRAPEPRQQYRLVFAWADHASESFAVGDDEWDIETQETPRTFVEIDGGGLARVKGWDSEHVLDILELWYDGPRLVFDAAELPDTKSLHAGKLQSEPE
ncbi:MAG: hypothetical protein ABEJ40_02140 [Haloarculaceae archaeon]